MAKRRPVSGRAVAAHQNERKDAAFKLADITVAKRNQSAAM
jgi:hypothetical protein